MSGITRPFELGATEVMIGQSHRSLVAIECKPDAGREGRGCFSLSRPSRWRKPGFPHDDDSH